MTFKTRAGTWHVHAARTASVGLLGIMYALNCFAQNNETGNQSGLLEEITVTAQKKSTSLQQTPLAITAMTGDMLESAGIGSTLDLQLATPGMVMSPAVVVGFTFIRGIGTDIDSVGSDPSVAYYLDGVYIPRPAATIQELTDVDRVEVVKGPQGTLYGRNATGGVINIITKLPSDKFQGSARAGFGDYGSQKFSGTVSGPLVGDRLLGSVSISKTKHDGYTENLFLGGTVGDRDGWVGHGILRYRPSDNLDVVMAVDHSDDDDSRGGDLKVLSADAPAAALAGGTVPSDPRKVLLDFKPTFKSTSDGVSGKVTWKANGLTFTSITAYRKYGFKGSIDVDGTQVGFFNQNASTTDSKSFSEELQLTSSQAGRTEWIAGLYYFTEDASQKFNLDLPLFGLGLNLNGSNKTTALAPFGQLTYKITDKLRVTGGLRYNREEKDHQVATFFNGIPTGNSTDKKRWTDWTPKFGVDYQASDNLFLYASITSGFKSGGFNSTAIQPAFNPEKILSQEAGLRWDYWEGRGRFNLTGFHYNYKDLQTNKYTPLGIVTIENAAKATVQGLEAEFALVPVQGLTLNLGAAFLDAKYDEYLTADPERPALGVQNLSGNKLTHAPDLTVSASAQYAMSLGGNGNLVSRVQFAYRGKSFYTPFNDIGVSDHGYRLWDASLRYTDPNDRWNAQLFVRNIGNELYLTHMARSAAFTGTVGYYGAPRTYGIEIGVDF